MGSINSYRDLIVWQKSKELTRQIYVLTRSFPKEEIYGLTSQLRRAAISVVANIAEGHDRCTPGEFRQFLGISRGSLAELETLVELSRDLGYMTEMATLPLLAATAEVGKLLNALLKAIKNH